MTLTIVEDSPGQSLKQGITVTGWELECSACLHRNPQSSDTFQRSADQFDKNDQAAIEAWVYIGIMEKNMEATF